MLETNRNDNNKLMIFLLSTNNVISSKYTFKLPLLSINEDEEVAERDAFSNEIYSEVHTLY